MALFAVVLIEREDFDCPLIKFIEAQTAVEAFEKFAPLTGLTVEELEDAEQRGGIYISIRECVEDTEIVDA